MGQAADPLLTWRTAVASPRKLLFAVPALALAVTAGVAWHAWEYLDFVRSNAVLMTRNFYGTLRVKEYGVFRAVDRRHRPGGQGQQPQK